MSVKLEEIKSLIKTAIPDAEITIEDLKFKYVGRKGLLNNIYSSFKSLDKEKKAKYGLILNDLKRDINSFIVTNLESDNKDCNFNILDNSLPGIEHNQGNRHPITIILDEIKNHLLFF